METRGERERRRSRSPQKKKQNTRLSLLLNLKFGIDQGVNYHIDRPGVKIRGGDSERTIRGGGGVWGGQVSHDVCVHTSEFTPGRNSYSGNRSPNISPWNQSFGASLKSRQAIYNVCPISALSRGQLPGFCQSRMVDFVFFIACTDGQRNLGPELCGGVLYVVGQQRKRLRETAP